MTVTERERDSRRTKPVPNPDEYAYIDGNGNQRTITLKGYMEVFHKYKKLIMDDISGACGEAMDMDEINRVANKKAREELGIFGASTRF